MFTTNKLFILLFFLLTILISLDYLTTYYGIKYLDAIELNPLYKLCGTLNLFFVVKTLLTGVGLFGIIYFSREHQTSVLVSLITLNIFYIIIIVSNIYQIYNI